MISVYLDDTGIPYEKAEQHFWDAYDWAKKNCPSFIAHHVQDVSDVSLTNDFVAQYTFKTSKDAEWFTLKWK